MEVVLRPVSVDNVALKLAVSILVLMEVVLRHRKTADVQVKENWFQSLF